MRRDEAWLLDIVIAARDGLRFTRGMTKDQFDADELRKHAILRVLSIIGEASRHLSPEMQGTLGDVPWPRIVSFRNQLIHGYFNIDMDKVWTVIQNDLEPLITRLEPLIPPDEDSNDAVD